MTLNQCIKNAENLNTHLGEDQMRRVCLLSFEEKINTHICIKIAEGMSTRNAREEMVKFCANAIFN